MEGLAGDRFSVDCTDLHVGSGGGCGRPWGEHRGWPGEELRGEGVVALLLKLLQLLVQDSLLLQVGLVKLLLLQLVGLLLLLLLLGAELLLPAELFLVEACLLLLLLLLELGLLLQ